MVSGADETLFLRTLDMFPAGDERLNSADPLDGDFVIVDCCANTPESFNIGVRVETLISRALGDEDQPASLIKTDRFYRDSQTLGHCPDWISWLVFCLICHSCNYKYKSNAKEVEDF